MARAGSVSKQRPAANTAAYASNLASGGMRGLVRDSQDETFGENSWRAEFDRGGWCIGFREGQPVSLLGVTREPDTPQHQCYLEYVWVSPECRRSGVAAFMLTIVLDQLRASGVRTAFLWVLDGNNAAVRLYKRLGFVSTNHRQPLADCPGRSEERMELDLGGRIW
jgi:ribosomal protein S18 acetylase RimI-like enzyme